MFLIRESMTELCQREYELQIIINRLRREVYQQNDPSVSPDILDELEEAESELEAIEEQRKVVQANDDESGLILNERQSSDRLAGGVRGVETTGLEAKVHLRMAQVPTAYYHLLDHQKTPLISCEIHADEDNEEHRRVRISSFIEGYSARAVNTFELAPDEKLSFEQLPTLFHGGIRDLNELTRATLNILIEDLDRKRVELHQTYPIWLLARTTAPLKVYDPKTGKRLDLTKYLGAFVTPNSPSLMKFLRIAAEQHPDGRLVGYQGDKDGVAPQIKALFDALKSKAGITYVNSVVSFNPDHGFSMQRVRLPRESLKDKEANCIDGAVLIASLIEGISMNPAIVIVPGHAMVAWETWRRSNEWKFLETTMIGSHTFEEACASGVKTAERYKKSGKLNLHSIRELRTTHGITPME